jgi:DNA-binding IclR family transcriptional regulator
MAAAGFLDRDTGPRPYRIGARLAALGVFAQQETSFQQLARPTLERLRSATGETASLAVLSGNQMVDIEVVESLRRVKHSDWVGRHAPLHATAAGKALIAWMPAPVIKKLVGSLTRFTPRTITRLPALMQELRQVRARGYAVAVRELEDDLVAVAAPIRNQGGDVLGVVAIGAPASRVPKQELPDFVKAVMEAAASASQALSFWPGADKMR